MPEIECPKCGTRLAAVAINAEIGVVAETDQKIWGVQRNFLGSCPTHGQFGGHRVGHHSTAIEARWGKAIAPAARKRIYEMLEGEALRRFKLARRGKIMPSQAEIERWNAIAGLQPEG